MLGFGVEGSSAWRATALEFRFSAVRFERTRLEGRRPQSLDPLFVSGCRLGVSDSRLQISGFGFQISGPGFQVSGFGNHVPGSRLEIPNLWVQG